MNNRHNCGCGCMPQKPMNCGCMPQQPMHCGGGYPQPQIGFQPMPEIYKKPCYDTKVINKYHVECERVEVPMVTHVVHHKIRKPIFVPVPMCTEEYMEHPYAIEDCCKQEYPTQYMR